MVSYGHLDKERLRLVSHERKVTLVRSLKSAQYVSAHATIQTGAAHVEVISDMCR